MTKQESDTGRFVWVMIGCLFVCLFVWLVVCLSETLYLVFSFVMCAVSAVCCMCGVVKGKKNDFVGVLGLLLKGYSNIRTVKNFL